MPETAISTKTIYRVAVPSPLRRLFDYLPPSETNKLLLPGCRVKVSFGRRQVTGIVVDHTDKSELPVSKLKPISEVLDKEPLLPEQLFKLFLWAARYYQHPVGDALATVFPALLRKGEPIPSNAIQQWRLTAHGKGLPKSALKRAPRQQQLLNILQQQPAITSEQLRSLELSRPVVKQMEEKGLIESFTETSAEAHSEKEVQQSWQPGELLGEEPLPLYPEQSAAMAQIEIDGFNTYLLHGETGSGKTEIYLQLIEKVVAAGHQALVLIPEISLTPQTLKRFEQRFNCPIATLHSGLTDRERALAWDSARTGVAPIVLGTRSAIFTPMKNPGLLIIDEEHDASFKQQDGFRYSARDIAVMRAKTENIPLLLGSATPSLESLHNCESGRYTRLRLTNRPGNARQPEWQLIDLRNSSLDSGFSRELITAMESELAQGNQILVFLNRRGFSPTLTCHNCGWVADCHRCEARLTVHRSINRLVCHHCEHKEQVPHQCPQCQSGKLQFLGQGTERSESILEALFPNTPVLRIDRDTTRQKQAMQTVIDKVDSGEPCILVGTQMLAKGHHFPNVTLVAILDADGGLFSSDFRAPERMGQLITQVAGRAGRGDKPGRVILQSHHSDHPLIELISQQGYGAFSQQLLKQRELAEMPPFQYMVLIRAEAHHRADAEHFLLYARQQAEALIAPSPSLQYLGPLPSPMERRSGRFRQQLSITSRQRQPLQQLLQTLCLQLEAVPISRKVRWSVDVDPQDMT